MSKRTLVISGLVLFVVALLLLTIVRFRAGDLIRRDQAWTASGSFKIGGQWAFTTFDEQMSSREKRLDFWGSWSGSQAYVGELRSPVFRAPLILQCFLSGYPGEPGLEVYLERQSDHIRYPLLVPGGSYPGEVWRRFHWWLPTSFRGQQVKLVAVDNAREGKGWLGISTPQKFSYLAVIHQELPSNLYMLGHFLLNFSFFLLPGLGLASLLLMKWPHKLQYPVVVVVATGALVGYLSFYAFFFSRFAGKLLVFSVYASAVVLIGLALKSRRAGLQELVRKIREPLAISALTALCYLSFTFVFVNPKVNGGGYVNGRFFNHQLPGDNLIPLFFAQRIYDRSPLRPFCCGGWLASDRPPLQTGIFLMERPLPLTTNIELNYGLLAVGLQCLWICGVWTFLTSMGVSVVHIRWALAFLIFSGLIFFESVFTWPKLLTAVLMLFALSIMADLIRSRRVATYADTILAAFCVGLALVSHQGSLFTLLTVPYFLIRFRALFPGRKLALILPILLLFVVPWMAFQRFVDPPGNRLVKWHLAGEEDVDSGTPVEAIHKAYKSHTWGEIAALRWSNIRSLAGFKPFDTLGLHDLPEGDPTPPLEWLRSMQQAYLWNGLGVLNFGWFAALFLFIRKRRSSKIRHAGSIILVVAVNMFLWCLIEFGPSFSVIADLSFTDLLLLSLGLLGFVLELPRILVALILSLQLAVFFGVWVWSPPYNFNVWAGTRYSVSLQYPLLALGVLFSVLLLIHLCRNASATSVAGYAKLSS